jgi:hypothetical protein
MKPYLHYRFEKDTSAMNALFNSYEAKRVIEEYTAYIDDFSPDEELGMKVALESLEIDMIVIDGVYVYSKKEYSSYSSYIPKLEKQIKRKKESKGLVIVKSFDGFSGGYDVPYANEENNSISQDIYILTYTWISDNVLVLTNIKPKFKTIFSETRIYEDGDWFVYETERHDFFDICSNKWLPYNDLNECLIRSEIKYD